MSLTIAVLALCAGASFWGWTTHSSAVWAKWGLIPYRMIHHREWYRLLTSVFFHADLMHLLINGVVFYSFGSAMEPYYGRELYLLLLLAGVAGSGLATYYWYRNNPYHVSIGLSGVVNAVLFAFILHHPETKLLVFFFFPLPAWLFALLYVAYSFYEAKRGVGMVNHWAHLGGAMAGVIFAAFIKS